MWHALLRLTANSDSYLGTHPVGPWGFWYLNQGVWKPMEIQACILAVVLLFVGNSGSIVQSESVGRGFSELVFPVPQSP